MKKIFYPVLLSIFLVSCFPAKMALSEELKAGNDSYKVKGRNGTRIKQKLSFGDYTTSSINRSWTKGSTSHFGLGSRNQNGDWVNIISEEYIRRKQTIRFNLANGPYNSEVYCVSRFNAKQLEIGKENSILNIGMDLMNIAGKSSNTYYVQIFPSAEADRPWEMIIDNERAQAKRKEYIGYLAKSRGEYYSIVPVYKMDTPKGDRNILAGTIGFEFQDRWGKPVAAVSLLDNGVVILGKVSEEERFLLANACTALLLQDVIG